MCLDAVAVELDLVDVACAGRRLGSKRGESWFDEARMLARLGAFDDAPDEAHHRTRAWVFARHISPG